MPLPPAAHLSQEGTQGLAQMPGPAHHQPLPPTPAPGRTTSPTSVALRVTPHTTDKGHSRFIYDSFLEHSHPVREQKCTA